MKLPLTNAPVPTVPVRVGISVRITDAGGASISLDFSDQTIQSRDMLLTLREALVFLENAVRRYAPEESAAAEKKRGRA